MPENSTSSPSFKDLEQSGWQAKAEGYASELVQVTAQAVDRALDAAEVTQGDHVLDVASGTGIGVAGALRRGATGVGVDFATAMVALAATNVPGGEFREGDGENLAFDGASFDAVICLFGLLHMPEPQRAIAEAHRVLRRGGCYVFTVWDTPQTHEFFAIVMGAIQKYGDPDVPLPPAPPMFRFSDPDTSREALSRVGFSQIEVQTIPLIWRGNSGRACLDLARNGTVRAAMLIEHQTPEAQKKIHRAIIDGAEQFRDGDTIEIAWPAVMASAVKT